MGCTQTKSLSTGSSRGVKEDSPLVHSLKGDHNCSRHCSNGENPSGIRVLVVGEEGYYTEVFRSLDDGGYHSRLLVSPEDAPSRSAIFGPHFVILDLRLPDLHQLLMVLKAGKTENQVIFIGVVKESATDKEETMNNALKSGFDRVVIERDCKDVVKELWGRGPVLSASLYLALEKSRDLVITTDNNNIIQFVNSPCLQVLGYGREEMTGKEVSTFQELGPSLRNLEKGFEWVGKLRWRTKAGETLSFQCRAIPFSPGPSLPTHYLYLQDNPFENHIYPRGSLPSIRKGSYDLKSIISEGSARRQSLAKLYNLPLEAPITKVLSLLCAAQENASPTVVQMLEQVMDILRTTELYTSHLKVDNLRAEDPLTTNLIAALVAQGPPSAIMPRRSSNESVIYKKKHPAKKSSTTALPASRELREALDKVPLWEFDVILVEKLTAGNISLQSSNDHNFSHEWMFRMIAHTGWKALGPLLYVGMKIFSAFNVYKTLGIDEKTAYGWLSTMEKNYKPSNTYHNSTHAADVLQATASFLSKLRAKKLLDPLDESCCLIAAATHDLGHPGKSSTFMTNSSDELAILYNDMSVLEQHHAALTFKLTLKDERINIFKALDRKTYTSARACIIDMILATDMFKHFEHYTKFVTVFNKTEENVASDLKNDKRDKCEIELDNSINPEDLMLVKRMLIKCADVSNPTRPLHLCKQWAKRIAEEYFAQTDEEKSRNLPVVMPLFDRSNCSIPVSQMGFMDYIVNNMFEEWDTFIEMPEMLYHLRRNYDYWKELHDKSITGTEDTDIVSKTPKSEQIPAKEAFITQDESAKQ